MSEYQYYEFQAIDRPLTEEEQDAVSSLSSRVDPHPRRAVFVYHYSSLRANAKELLARYYDAMFYVANWGTTRLMFRFPKELIDVKQIERYCVEHYVTCETIDDYVVLDMRWSEEGGYYDWVKGEGSLDGLITLRDDILQQDYRVLYLAWLSALHTWEIEEETIEPPVPPGLQKLTPPLRRFMEAFHVDESLVTVAAAASPTRRDVSEAELRQNIAALSRDECDEWLLRLAQGKEAHLSLVFQRYLLSGRETAPMAPGRRTAAELLAMAEVEAGRVSQLRAAEAEAQRIRELEALAPKAEDMWTFAEQLIQQGNSRAYDEAVQLLVKLHDLAIHKGTEAAYAKRLRRIRATYSRRQALLRRLDEASLP
ncbi:MAG TPA: hypothetical protein VF177_17780 [Anaerolineae bacterium]